MASRTVYTSIISIPAYASWKCEECGEVNFSRGVIECKREETSRIMFYSKKIEQRVTAQAEADWAPNALKIISDTNNSGSEIYNNCFRLEYKRCAKCGKKPRWNKNVRFLFLLPFCFVGVLLGGYAAFVDAASVDAWLILFASIGIIACYILREVLYKRMLRKLPKKYTPVIGSDNYELIEYAESLGKKIPDPDECIAIVKAYDQVGTPEA